MTTATIAAVTRRLLSASLLFLRGAGLHTLANRFHLTPTEMHCCSVYSLGMIKRHRQYADGMDMQ